MAFLDPMVVPRSVVSRQRPAAPSLEDQECSGCCRLRQEPPTPDRVMQSKAESASGIFAGRKVRRRGGALRQMTTELTPPWLPWPEPHY